MIPFDTAGDLLQILMFHPLNLFFCCTRIYRESPTLWKLALRFCIKCSLEAIGKLQNEDFHKLSAGFHCIVKFPFR